MTACSTTPFSANGRHYHPPARPVVVVCLDGSADEYLDAAMARGLMPHLQSMSVNGWRGFARAAMPTFTNVNNTSIVTGVPPAVHGISGNYFLDPLTGQEVMMNSASFLRAPTLFPAAAKAGRKVAVVTAKEKLRDIFASGLVGRASSPASPSDAEGAGRMPALPGGIAFSSEKARDARLETHGIGGVEALVGPTPQIYSGDASIYVLKSGVRILEAGRADFLYLSTTDYIQHGFAPDEAGALEFYAGIDQQIGRLLELGAVIGVTADHGMNAKQTADGAPNVVYLESELVQAFEAEFRVILPITDPYVAHHGALGSFAWVHLPEGMDSFKIARWLCERAGITEVLGRAAAARKLQLPADRIGDLAVLAGRDTVLGRTPEHHDLSALHGGLRSHGGRYEEMVPFLLSQPLKPAFRARAMADVRNFDIFDFTCNGIAL
jgi:phosphonoacetate hydrolase